MKRNKKGFTLIELLAVIVILAIIMIIAVPNVLTAMESARKNSFVIEARKIQNAAIAKRQADTLAGKPDQSAVGGTCTTTNGTKTCCYTLAGIGVDSGGKYHGTVKFTLDTSSMVETWEVKVNDESYQTKTYTSMNGIDSKSDKIEPHTGNNNYSDVACE